MLSGMDKQSQSEAVENYMRTHASDLMKQSDQVVEAFTSSMDALRIPNRAGDLGRQPEVKSGTCDEFYFVCLKNS